MATVLEGTTVADVEAQKSMTPAQLEASVKAFESQATPPPSTAQEVTPTPPAETTPPATTTVEAPQQVQVKEEKPVTAEPPKETSAERERRLIEQNRALREKVRIQGEELKATKEEAKSVLAELPKGNLTPEFKKQIMEQIEKDPVEAIIALSKLSAQQELNPRLSKFEAIEKQVDETRAARELDSLISKGHDWIATEGLGRFEVVFKERPYLLQSPTPYADAVRFLDVPTTQPPAPQVGAKTPILGATRAVPPPSNLPPVSIENETERHALELEAAAKIKDPQARKAALATLETKMDEAMRQGKIL